MHVIGKGGSCRDPRYWSELMNRVQSLTHNHRGAGFVRSRAMDGVWGSVGTGQAKYKILPTITEELGSSDVDLCMVRGVV